MNIFLCDSPTLDTGFAKVSRNILQRLDLKEKHVWALGYNGEPHNYNCNLYPANINSNWESDLNKQNFANFLFSFGSGSTLWTLHDPFRLRGFKDIFIAHKQNGGKLISYVPVDSPLEAKDAEFLDLVDVIVAYTKYGQEEIKKIVPHKNVVVIPHGFDPFFRKVEHCKEVLFPKFKDKILIGNINSNTQRKNLFRSLEIFYHLDQIKPNKYCMYFHCNTNGFYDLKGLALKLGVLDKVIFADPFFENTRIGKTNCSQEVLLGIYNSLDLFLTTSLGEGWGLTVSEAALCEVPICLPRNSAFNELYSEESCLWMEPKCTSFYNGNILNDVDAKLSAKLIHSRLKKHDPSLAKEDVRYSWDDVCFYWNKIFKP